MAEHVCAMRECLEVRARLVEVEAERDRLATMNGSQESIVLVIAAERDKAQARLAAVEAAVWALDSAIDYGAPEDPETGERWVVLGSFSTELDELITAARGEGDRG